MKVSSSVKRLNKMFREVQRQGNEFTMTQLAFEPSLAALKNCIIYFPAFSKLFAEFTLCLS